ncbi:hypothetical protein BLD44_028400 [Mastigocladus laminosus UU774]|nr:hypothetical protein BLD44_028400 [Mastigocladus laminosus UU774]
MLRESFSLSNSLSAIAEREFGDVAAFREILDANNLTPFVTNLLRREVYSELPNSDLIVTFELPDSTLLGNSEVTSLSELIKRVDWLL